MPTTDYKPTLEELGTFMRTRTKTRYGAVVGTFTDSTPVTDEQATELIEQAVDEVAIAVGANLPSGPEGDEDIYKKGAKALILLLSSMNVELQLAPEQVNDPRSPYAALERRYTAFRKSLIEAVTEARGGTGGGESAGEDPGGYGFPSGGFPEASDTGSRAF